jgi:hypothetical protein
MSRKSELLLDRVGSRPASTPQERRARILAAAELVVSKPPTVRRITVPNRLERELAEARKQLTKEDQA